MTSPTKSGEQGYEGLYTNFDSPLMQKVRREAYGEDIGQHSWVTAADIRRDVPKLGLSPASRLLDLGCGPCGPLAFIVGLVGCHGTGVDVSAIAVVAGRARVDSQGLASRVTVQEVDLNAPLPFATGFFDAVISLDVILHLRDRLAVFREVARVLAPGRRFLFTDAGVVTGAVSDEDIRLRAAHGYTQFAPSGLNERLLRLVGFRLIESTDCTASLLDIAKGRLAARAANRREIEQLEGSARFQRQQQYLEIVVDLSRRGAVRRMMYLSETRAA